MTWLPTAVFAALSRLHAWDPACGPIVYLGPTLMALVIVPPVWRWFVIRQGRPRLTRTPLAGAALAFLIFTVPLVIASVMFYAHGRSVDAFGEGLGNLFTMISITGSLLIGGPVGAGVAALVALLQRRWWRDAPAESGAADPILDGAIGGALIATLAGPVVGPFAALLLPLSLQPLLPNGATDISMMLLWAWLVMLPAGAVIGALGVRRWRRIVHRAATA